MLNYFALSPVGLFWPLAVFCSYSVYLSTTLLFPVVGKPVAGVLLLLGVVGYLAFKCKHSNRFALQKTELFLVISFCLFSIVSIISFFYWPHTRIAQMHLEDYGTFILLVPLYLLLREIKFDLRYLIVMLALAACLLGVTSIVQYISMSHFGHQIRLTDNTWSHMWLRPSGGVNPMRYGALSLVLSVVALNGLIWIKHNPKWLKVLLSTSVVMGLVACYLADSRSSFVAIPVLAALYGIYLYRTGNPKLLLGLVVIAFLLLVGLSQNKRMQNIMHSVEQYQAGNAVTSLGARFDMFTAAVILIKDQPVWGYGLGSYLAQGKVVRRAHPHLHRDVGMWSNPHNEILLVMVEKGVIGLITLILLFAAPAYLFIRALRKDDEVIRYYALGGLSLLVVYAVVGQSVALFQHDVFNHFFVLMIILFTSQIRSHEHYLSLENGSNEVPG